MISEGDFGIFSFDKVHVSVVPTKMSSIPGDVLLSINLGRQFGSGVLSL